jgi:hypothetical protein
MRTTVTLEDDVAAAVLRLQSEEGIGRSDAVNRLVRAGLTRPAGPTFFQQRSVGMGPFLLDVSSAGDALEMSENQALRLGVEAQHATRRHPRRR